MAAYEKAKLEKVKNPAKHVASLGLRGHYRCCMYKWAKPRLAQNWPLLCKAAPQIAKKFKEIPDVLRKFMGLKGKFRARLSSNETGQKTIPSSLMSVVSDCAVPSHCVKYILTVVLRLYSGEKCWFHWRSIYCIYIYVTYIE